MSYGLVALDLMCLMDGCTGPNVSHGLVALDLMCLMDWLHWT